MNKAKPGETTCTFSYELSVRTRLEALAKSSGVDLSLTQMMRLAANYLADCAEARGVYEIMREVAEKQKERANASMAPKGLETGTETGTKPVEPVKKPRK